MSSTDAGADSSRQSGGRLCLRNHAQVRRLAIFVGPGVCGQRMRVVDGATDAAPL